MSTFLQFALELFVIFLLVAANGFFVAAEFALVKIRASQLQPLAKTGGWRVKFALKATKHLDAALSATQLGITLASLGLGWLGEPFLAHRMEPLLRWFGITEAATISSIAFIIAFSVITFLHIIFGELAPKSLAIQKAKPVSLAVSAPLMLFYYVFFPFIWTLNGTANLFLRWAGMKPASEGEHTFSSEELEYVFSHARHAHPGDSLVNKLMVQSLRARQTQAHQIMRLKDQVVALWLDKSVKENMRIAQVAGHSRFPVCEGSLDNVVGVVLIKEWLWQVQFLGPDAHFNGLVRPILSFRLNTPVHTMIERFRMGRSHLAVVLDDDNKMAGIISFEDVLEEIVGDIRDELDIEANPVHERSDVHIVINGTLLMRELQAETGWPIEWQPRETVAGWLVRVLGRLPKRGESVTTGEYRITALEATSEKVRRVRVDRIDPTAASAE